MIIQLADRIYKRIEIKKAVPPSGGTAFFMHDVILSLLAAYNKCLRHKFLKL
jgi:hypothetical protein